MYLHSCIRMIRFKNKNNVLNVFRWWNDVTKDLNWTGKNKKKKLFFFFGGGGLFDWSPTFFLAFLHFGFKLLRCNYCLLSGRHCHNDNCGLGSVLVET